MCETDLSFFMEGTSKHITVWILMRKHLIFLRTNNLYDFFLYFVGLIISRSEDRYLIGKTICCNYKYSFFFNF